jgi:hypothetical protein
VLRAVGISSARITHSHLWQWPQFMTMFGLGILAAHRGWLDPVPDRIQHGCAVPRSAASLLGGP